MRRTGYVYAQRYLLHDPGVLASGTPRSAEGYS